MNKNMGKNQRMIHAAVGVAGLILGYYVNPWLYLVAVIGFITAAMGWCMVNHLFGFNTCKTEKK